jgi:hypothetical protein
MNYNQEFIVVAKAGEIDVIVGGEKMFYQLNKKYLHYVIKFNVNHLDLIHKTYRLLQNV